MVKIALWNAMLLICTPVQALLTVLHPVVAAAGADMIFTGYDVDAAGQIPFV